MKKKLSWQSRLRNHHHGTGPLADSQTRARSNLIREWANGGIMSGETEEICVNGKTVPVYRTHPEQVKILFESRNLDNNYMKTKSSLTATRFLSSLRRKNWP